MPAKRKVIVDRGVLKGFMHSLESSSRMNCESTGNGRACSYDAPPIVRMSNTFIDRGDSSLEEMLSEMRDGIYAIGSLYGYTNPAKGQFMFKAEEGWLVEKGELKQRLREVALSGDILSILGNVELIGKDLSFQGGYCGKDGQTVPVSIGSPHVLVKEVVFGGMG
jgi:TldD protein